MTPTIGPVPAGVRAKGYPDGRAVLWRGSVFGPESQNPPPDQPPYTVTIDGVSKNIPSHGWRQRATFRSAPISIKNKPDQIVAAKRFFPMADPGGPGIGNTAAIAAIPPFKGPFDNSTTIKGMTQTGGGSDRWLITDEASYFMRTGIHGPMIAKALSADSVPVNDIDENTGKPVDLLKYPTLNCMMNGVSPSFAVGPKDASGHFQCSDGWGPSSDHYPSLCYIAFQATYDLGFLLNLQTSANFPFLSDWWTTYNLSGTPRKATLNAGQTRQLAWPLRMLFEAHTATLDAEAAGIDLATYDLLPSSYFKTLLDNNLAFYTKQMQDPQRQQFRLLGPDIWPVGPWQCDYLHMTLAFGVLTGHSDWAPLFLWTLGNPIARTSGKSGWPQCYPVAYYMNTIAKGDVLQADTVPPAPRLTWAQAFDDQVAHHLVTMPQAEHDAIKADPSNGGKLCARDGGGGGDGTMFAGVRFALIAADHVDKLGLAGVRAMYPEFDTCLSNVQGMLTNKGPAAFAERFCIVAATQSQPPTTQPPAGAIYMGKTFTIAVGQTIHLPMTFDDGHGGASLPPTGVTYQASPIDAATLVPDASGVAVTGLKSVPVNIAVHADNGLVDSTDGVVTLPLAGAIHLNA